MNSEGLAGVGRHRSTASVGSCMRHRASMPTTSGIGWPLERASGRRWASSSVIGTAVACGTARAAASEPDGCTAPMGGGSGRAACARSWTTQANGYPRTAGIGPQGSGASSRARWTRAALPSWPTAWRPPMPSSVGWQTKWMRSCGSARADRTPAYATVRTDNRQGSPRARAGDNDRRSREADRRRYELARISNPPCRAFAHVEFKAHGADENDCPAVIAEDRDHGAPSATRRSGCVSFSRLPRARHAATPRLVAPTTPARVIRFFGQATRARHMH